MSGNGKYTQYAPPANEKNILLEKLFRSDDATLRPLTQGMVGKETELRQIIVAIGVDKLQPVVQQGDLGFFPTGVDLNFSDAPNLSEVKWNVAGDPANSFVPDITSPGPGKTDGLDKDSDPQITAADLKPDYVPGAPGTGTKSPSATNAKLIAAAILGVTQKMGDSGANV